MALTLKRAPGESICVGDSLRVTVLKIKNKEVELRFEAPREVLVIREELLEDGCGGYRQSQ